MIPQNPMFIYYVKLNYKFGSAVFKGKKQVKNKHSHNLNIKSKLIKYI